MHINVILWTEPEYAATSFQIFIINSILFKESFVNTVLALLFLCSTALMSDFDYDDDGVATLANAHSKLQTKSIFWHWSEN